MCFAQPFRIIFGVVFWLHFATADGRAIYTVTDLGGLNDLSGQSKATINAVNFGGKTVGVSATNGSYLSFIADGTRTNLGTLGGAAGVDTNCFALGINAANVVCGTSLNPDNYNRAFRWTPGATNGVPENPQMVDLGALTGFNLNHSEANDINANGQIVGESFDDAGNNYDAVIFNTNGTITDIGALISAPNSFSFGISPSGQVVGSAYDQFFSFPEAFFYNGSFVMMLGDLRGVNGLNAPYNSEAFGISGAGQVCGYALKNVITGESHAFRWIQGGTGGVPGNPRMIDLGILATGRQSSAWGINASNVIVGESTLTSNDASTPHAFIATNNVMLDLNGLLDASSNNWELVKAEYINDVGTICGYGNFSGTLHGFLLTPAFPPVITNQPSPVAVVVGNNATFTVVAGGNPAPAYQWRLNGTNLSYGLGASLTITNCQAANAGNYSVVLTNFSGGVTSAPAALTVNFPPGISAQPSPVSVVVSNSATFSVTASGTATLVYQWRQNGTNLSYATGISLTLANCQATNAGNYSVIITNNFGSVTSAPAALTVNFPPSITAPPSSQSVLVGSNATFTCAASGTAPLAYQWKFTAPLTGQTNTACTVNNAQAGNAGNYSVVVTNYFGSVTSAPVYLNVVPSPSLASINVTNANVLLAFNTSTGATYVVESKTNLAVGSWQAAVTNLAGSGGTKMVTHTNGAGGPSQFYRVRVTVP
jgi:hypothetical protein